MSSTLMYIINHSTLAAQRITLLCAARPSIHADYKEHLSGTPCTGWLACHVEVALQVDVCRGLLLRRDAVLLVRVRWQSRGDKLCDC